jgi:hypothetical protein
MTRNDDHSPVVGHPAPVLRPSALAPDASVGEVTAEIDRTRHEAAKTVAALAGRFTVKSQATRRVRNRLQAVRWDGRRVRQDVRAVGAEASEAIPPGYADLTRKAVDVLRRLPRWITIGVPAVLLVRIMLKSRRRR